MKTKSIFCTNELKDTEHSVILDQNGEFVFTCLSEIPTGKVDENGKDITTLCERSIKFTAESKDELDAKIALHEKVNNKPIVTQESIDKKLDDFI